MTARVIWARCVNHTASNPTNWNMLQTLTSAGVKVANAVFSDGTSSWITVELLDAFDAASSSGTQVDADQHSIPQVCWEHWGQINADSTKRVQLSGFQAGQTGTIKFAGINAAAARDVTLNTGSGAVLYDNAGGTVPLGDAGDPITAPAEAAFTADGSGVAVLTFGTAAGQLGVLNFFIVEYDDAPLSVPTISNVDTDNDVTAGQTGVNVNGTSFRASQGAGSITITSPSSLTTITQTVTSWGDTAAQITVVNIDGDSALPYKAGHTLTLTDSAAASDTHTITLSAPAGTTVVDVVSPDTTSASLFQDATPAVADGDQVWWDLVSGTNVVVNASGTMTADSATAVITFRLWDATDETISAEYAATLSNGVVSVGGGRKQFRISFGMGF